MIPNNRLKTLEHHKYGSKKNSWLKLCAIYGSNGAGKSNLIKTLRLLQKFVIQDNIPVGLKDATFKFGDLTEHAISIDFIQDGMMFRYSVLFDNEIVISEDLYILEEGKKDGTIVYKRKTDRKGCTSICFFDEFEKNEKCKLIKAVLLEEFVQPNSLIIRLFAKRENPLLNLVRIAYRWFDETLTIIEPDSGIGALAQEIDSNEDVQKNAIEFVRSLSLGISELNTSNKRLDAYFDAIDEAYLNELLVDLDNSPDKMIGIRSRTGDELVLVNENNEVRVKTLNIVHSAERGKTARFDLKDESDGTVRLFDLIIVFMNIVKQSKLFVIDELDRSIHPVLLKALVTKFSQDQDTKGQLIFTTHETNLLDQSIFRQDEIWFTEKNGKGISHLYSLNDFKEHKTIDIQKGYLSGRYGSIPQLDELIKLEWNSKN